MDTTNIKIAVIITVHNRKEETYRCLDLLYKQIISSNIKFHTYLTDDGSIDGTTQMIKNNFPEVVIINGDGDLFWNRGMYKAWQMATISGQYDFYLWLNNDTFLYPHAIQTLIERSNIHNNYCIIIGSTQSNNGILTYGGRKYNMEIITPSNNNDLKCDTFNGNIVLIPHKVYEKIGLLDYKFRHSLGDIDYGLRAKSNNISSYVAPGYLGICEAHTTYPNWCNPQVSLAKRIKSFYSPLGNNPFEHFIFAKRHYGLLSASIHFVTNHLRVVFPKLWINK